MRSDDNSLFPATWTSEQIEQFHRRVAQEARRRLTMETQAMTIRLPKELYERLRREAFEKRVSQASIVVDAIEKRLGRDGETPELPSCGAASVTPSEFDAFTRKHGVRWEEL